MKYPIDFFKTRAEQRMWWDVGPTAGMRKGHELIPCLSSREVEDTWDVATLERVCRAILYLILTIFSAGGLLLLVAIILKG